MAHSEYDEGRIDGRLEGFDAAKAEIARLRPVAEAAKALIEHGFDYVRTKAVIDALMAAGFTVEISEKRDNEHG